MSELPDYKRANRTVACTHCGADPGEPCRDKSGRSTKEHSARCRVVSLAFRIGIEGGLSDALKIGDWGRVEHQYDAIRAGNLRWEADR